MVPDGEAYERDSGDGDKQFDYDTAYGGFGIDVAHDELGLHYHQPDTEHGEKQGEVTDHPPFNEEFLSARQTVANVFELPPRFSWFFRCTGLTVLRIEVHAAVATHQRNARVLDDRAHSGGCNRRDDTPLVEVVSELSLTTHCHLSASCSSSIGSTVPYRTLGDAG